MDIATAAVCGAAVGVAGIWAGMLGDRFSSVIGFSPAQLLSGPAALALAGIALALALWNRVVPRRLSVAAAAFGLLFLWSLVSQARSHYHYASFATFAILSGALALGASVRWTCTDRRMLTVFVAMLVVAGGLVAAMGVSEYLQEARGGNPTWRVFVNFVSPNFLAGYLAMVLPVSAALFLAARDRGVTALSGLALLLDGACLMVTGSREAMGAVAVGLLVFAVLAVRAGALRGASRGRALALLGIGVAAILIGARPVLHRLTVAGTESYSMKFRLLTWAGALRMAEANPVLGTGIGTFDTAYGPYAAAAFTQHAHSSYLQLAAETGVVGALCLLAGMGAVLVAGVRVRREPNPPEAETDPSPEPALLVAGLVAAVVGAALRNLFDSDLYVPANALTFAYIVGLILAVASWSRMAEEHPAFPRSLTCKYALLAAAVLVLYGGAQTFERIAEMGAESALRAGDAQAAISNLQSASVADPEDPEPLLELAVVYDSTGRPAPAEEAIRRAIRDAPIGKTYYRLGKLLVKQGRLPEAIQAFERARQIEPHNLQTLLALADAYQKEGRSADAVEVYRAMVALYASPYGKVRALPELVTWEFGTAYLGLADAAIAQHDAADALADLQQAATVFDEFWRSRNLQIVHVQVRPDVLKSVADQYDRTLEEWPQLLRQQGRAAEADALDARRTRLHEEMQKEFQNPPQP